MKKVDPNISEEELLRLIKEGKIFMAAEDYDKMKAEQLVRGIVRDILDQDVLDDPKKITGIQIEDRGRLIHATFTGQVCTSTIVSIGNAFGDDNPLVNAVGDNTIRIDF